MDYKKYNDYELISMVCENDEDSYYSLFSKYEPIIKSIAQEFAYLRYLFFQIFDFLSFS